MCVLRVFGSEFDPAAALAGSTLQPYSAYRRGDRRFKVGDATHNTSGLKVEVSNAEWTDRKGQFQDAMSFLRAHRASLRSLSHRSDIEGMVLDFPFELPGAATFIRIPIDLAREASEVGIAIEISMYPTGEDGKSERVVPCRLTTRCSGRVTIKCTRPIVVHALSPAAVRRRCGAPPLNGDVRRRTQ
jgi:hypothetical protein